MKQLLKILIFIFLLPANPGIAMGQSDTAITLNLSDCIKAALDFSPNLKEGLVQTEIKKTAISRAKSYQYPSVSANAVYNLTNQNRSGNNYNSASYGINAYQTLWQYGRNKALVEQSKFLYQAEWSNYHALQQDVVVNIKQFYFNYLHAVKLLGIAKSNRDEADLFLNAAKEKKAIGIGKNSDILKAESDVADTKFIYSLYENDILRMRNELMRLTGLIITENTILQDELFTPDPTWSNISPDTLFSIAKNNYPELRAIDGLIKSQEAYRKFVKADLFPKLSAGAGYNGYYNPVMKNMDFWNAGFTLSWDIFNGYQKKYQVKTEKLQSEALSWQKEYLLLSVQKEIRNQYLTFNENYYQIGIIETLLKSTTENLNTVLEEYRQGVSSMLELANARIENFNAKEKYCNAWFTYQISKVQLERMLGVTNK